MRAHCRWLLVLLFSLLQPPSFAGAPSQDDEDEDLSPPQGLLATYTAGDATVQTIDPGLAFRWRGRADERLPAGAFRADWRSRLLMQQAGNYRFHARLDGRLKLVVADQVVLEASAAGGWVDGPETTLPFGDHPIEVHYESRPNGHGELRVFWSSDAFPLEPIAATLFSCEQQHTDIVRDRQSRKLADAHRCLRCHGDSDALVDPGPSLAKIRDALPREWIISRLVEPPTPEDDSKMPHFGFSRRDAGDIADFLTSVAQAPQQQRLPNSAKPEDDRVAGRGLVRTLGCLACHTLDGVGTNGPYSGGSLSAVSAKRSAEWVYQWLAEPGQLNRDHRMPVFRLSKEERRQLAVSLGGKRTATTPSEPVADRIEHGRELVMAARCASCHRIPGVPHPGSIKPTGSWSCLEPSPGAIGPRFPQLDRETMHLVDAWRLAGHHQTEVSGGVLLERRNCTACHARDANQGILPVVGQLVEADPELRSISQALIPPALTAVGDKLTDAALREAVSGQQQAPRLPWLEVRMPRFQHSAAERDALVSFLIRRDRILARTVVSPRPPAPSKQTLVAGQALIGSTGFSCIACHSAGTYTPRNVALGTRGSDLLMPGQRMRREYFLRWTRSPARIVPGMEMPSITRPVAGVLDGQIDSQLVAVWDALNDREFTVPTHVAGFEQFVVVRSGQPPQIIRDVFTDPDGEGYIARPMAIGFGNGHNMMFDLDLFGLRHWWFGDMARQRTEGKSWYWDVAGIAVQSEDPGADVVLQDASGKLIQPQRERATHGRLTAWSQSDNHVEFAYTLRFRLSDRMVDVPVTELIRPIEQAGLLGWTREVQPHGVPQGYRGLVRLLPGGTDCRVAAVEGSIVESGGRKHVRFADGTVRIDYLSDLQRPSVRSIETPELIATPDEITTVPGFSGVRLPVSRSIMPTSIQRMPGGDLVFSSLKGHVLVASDSDGDGIEDALREFGGGLAAPFGVLPDGRGLIVAHKPEVVRLTDSDGDGRADRRQVLSTGWGYSDNYHDWTCGFVRDSKGNLYFGLGSDYSQPQRPVDRSLWRGAVLRLSPDGRTEPVSWSFRYPVGFAIDRQDRVFVTDNQGVQNTFNEINHVQPGRHYGVPSRHEPDPEQPETTPAIRVPHPWVRSVNGIVFLPEEHKSPFAGHAIGAEYDTHLLIRLSFQTVGQSVQGAAYYFSRPGYEGGGENFVGPICLHADDNGDLYIGSIHDSGWLGGRNTGAIERLRFQASGLPNGIRELRATPRGFEIELLRAPSVEVVKPQHVSISAYTRKWQGSYATPDSSRHDVPVSDVTQSSDGRTLSVTVGVPLRREFVYEVSIGALGADLFPATGHYTMKQVPAAQAD